MKKGLLTALALMTSLLLGSASAGGAGAPATGKTQNVPVPVATAATGGRFIVKFEPSKIKGMNEIAQKLKKDGIIEGLLHIVDRSIKLPVNVPITFQDCGYLNAAWDPAKKGITYCYDLMDLYSKGYAAKDIEESDRPLLKGLDNNDILYGTTLFVIFHELGHGMITLYNLPVTGREEDAVDQLSTLTLLDLDKVIPANTPVKDRPGRLALLGAYFFKRVSSAPNSGITRDLFADEHNMGQQRFYDVTCLVMGSNPEVYGPLVASGYAQAAQKIRQNPKAWSTDRIKQAFIDSDSLNILPAARADHCDAEYAKYNSSWQYFINEFMAKGKIRN